MNETLVEASEKGAGQWFYLYVWGETKNYN